MIIDIDLTGEHAAIQLLEPEDCKRFHVAVRARGAGGVPPTAAARAARDSALETLGAVLPAHEIGQLLPSGDALIEVQAVRRLADGRTPDGWDRDFAAMVDYAKSKGWFDADHEAIQAHVEWAG
ncbi:MAG TPA: hypothetical protein VEG38_21520 [Acidimicrobiia bacterium]|nr:hypothetical protein [Acidimicrobiia bacterium]